MNTKEVIIKKMIKSFYLFPCFQSSGVCTHISYKNIKKIIAAIQQIMFPEFYCGGFTVGQEQSEYLHGKYDFLFHELSTMLDKTTNEGSVNTVQEIMDNFMKRLPDLREITVTDIQAAYYGDPAANSYEEIICAYPGFYAIFVNRIAHILYELNVSILPRMMTEYAHTMTGVDIHPGARIGNYFFIDHGTGVVIGETAVIGNHVKIYQGVTLGALTTNGGQTLKNIKRHPTLKDYVTVYAGATILGGNTVIGEGVVIGGNAFITASIPMQTQVSMKRPELQFKDLPGIARDVTMGGL